MTFKKAEESFLIHCQFEKKLSNKTIKAYTSDFKQFRKYLLEENLSSNIEEVSKETLRLYLKRISHFKTKTIKRKIATLKALFNFLEFEDILVSNPFRKLKIKIQDPRTLPEVMDAHEVKSIFMVAYSGVEDLQNQKIQYRTRTRDIAVLELLFATGMRVSELCNLKKDQINLRSGAVTIKGKGGKHRLLHICNKEAKDVLQKYSQLFKQEIDQSRYFFINRLGSRLSTQSVRYMVKHYAQKARLNRKITPHTFRHTFATLLLEEGVDITYIQQFLGHSSISTTQIYTHVNKAKQRQILRLKHPRNRFDLS
ncbi:MAG: tyrosine-type recombinase/integrase [Balneolaceae bacterium]